MKSVRLFLCLWALCLFTASSFFLVQHNYLSDIVLHEISDHIVRASSPSNAPLLLGAIPYDIPTIFYDLIAHLGGNLNTVIPGLISIASVSGLIWLSCTPSTGQTGPRPAAIWIVLFAAASALNPIVLWTATATGEHALATLVFAWLCSTVTQITERQDPGAYLKFGLAATLLIMCDPTGIIMLIAMIPWIILTTPRNEDFSRVFSYYLVTFIPVAMTGLAVSYLNWVAIDRFSPLITPLNSGYGQDFPWNRSLTAVSLSDRLDIVPIFMLASVAFFPVLVLTRPFESDRHRRAFAVVLLTIFTAPAIAALGGTPYHILDYLPYLTGPLVMIARQTSPRHRATTLSIQLVSVAFGWALLVVPGASLSNGWTPAITGSTVAGYEDERNIARWITSHPNPVTIDPHTDYRIIALVGRTAPLVMPTSSKGTTIDIRSLSQILLTSRADSEQGEVNRLNALAPSIWASGVGGYSLAFEQGIYRIWTRVAYP